MAAPSFGKLDTLTWCHAYRASMAQWDRAGLTSPAATLDLGAWRVRKARLMLKQGFLDTNIPGAMLAPVMLKVHIPGVTLAPVMLEVHIPGATLAPVMLGLGVARSSVDRAIWTWSLV